MSKYKIKMNGKEYEMEVELADGSTPVAPAPVVKNTQAPAPSKKAASPVAATAGSVISPMPGTILKVNVKQGDAVKAGDSVIILEAMKMENDITAPKDGIIKSIFVEAGQSVAKDDALFEVE